MAGVLLAGPTPEDMRTRPHSSATGRTTSRVGRRRRADAPGFTLVELIVVIALVAVLASLLLPAAAGALASARSVRCQVAQRGVAFDFWLFADEQLHGNRGDDTDRSAGAFRLETFIDSQYGVDEFWEWGPGEYVELRESGADPMRCPEVAGDLRLRSGVPCSQGGIGPPAAVSFGFNIRLHIAERAPGGSGPLFSFVNLHPNVLDLIETPLLWDVDGAAASGVHPIFSGPALDSPVVFAADRYWFPAMRHGGKLNVAFVDGHVASSRDPLGESGWNWAGSARP